ncbi:hypothetical protein A3H65_02240 [Candidatus Giovannonibacteria bacterium RIFCSPLOWO2_02_FULL_45_14]|uniref:Glycosyltransferase RgtA/B/C/D-like domain-containing protein n=1 Tax=Candidatus Giovannonibacteria bacterium RIFCSPLOWO2_12_FULL_44_15 TaxID=1798364 RepID=A0A1F5Y168_9BACT|nr:MAG: hypothetical protein A3C75_03030 [Candidatus Giovannonibacteria bacterium RIFCSPHIGHO2_02_FULL_44_31]OGF76741.1 MAG: hypothetical protein A3E62_02965 [Candidatus Giovannonibacteria bacterium RIFCSPHIGHO2_12_FULL_44_29]OGF90725.1 MAG: hypothetical protein A3H65_02240 [Candidatus Giovannonibacteria bacterium RIFCSPLOWO2_02_FULL_45_14]OGF93822.1 MAG: hypothetical protein A3G54_02390 [Candidatus Giovannonibacteria bacterium RIFCSPLOWO2_12_FULL_44_15]
MANAFVIKKSHFRIFPRIASIYSPEDWVMLLAFLAGLLATVWAFVNRYITAYGDAESHLNIAKRVVDSLTPGFAQLGGIWLPLPHILLMPFVYFDIFWRSGLAGSIVSGIAFVVSALYIYKTTQLLTKNTGASFLASLIFILNPNVLYLQSTPMTELPLIVFFVLSTYYFILFMEEGELYPLIMSALFGLFATLSRYDGWALVLMEAGILFLYYLWRRKFQKFEGRLILFATLAFFGIFLWLLWSFLILGDPLYFTHSQFSANSQQMGWLAKGQLPAYHDIAVSLEYYFVASMSSAGVLVFIASILGMLVFLFDRTAKNRFYILLLLLVPFFFNVITLFLGQSIMFMPGLTPTTFEWTLFNVRYGVLMAPFAAIFVGYLAAKNGYFGKILLAIIVLAQTLLFLSGFSPVLAFEDGTRGLSSATAKLPDAQYWLARNYDDGLILMDDYKRVLSIIRTPIPMENIIYIGNKPYWEESLVAPEKYANWIIIQRDDDLWRRIYEDPGLNGRLYKYFEKAYTSDDILIFKRIGDN